MRRAISGPADALYRLARHQRRNRLHLHGDDRASRRRRLPWPATRALIADKGIDVQDAAVVDLIPIRHNIGYLVALVGPKIRVFSLCLGIIGDPSEPKTWSDLAYMAEWHELNSDEARSRYGNELDIARRLLDDARAFRPNERYVNGGVLVGPRLHMRTQTGFRDSGSEMDWSDVRL